MNFSEALIAMKNGKSIRRSSWQEEWMLFIPKDNPDRITRSWGDRFSEQVLRVYHLDILANDWEVI